jgi:hypothetical protein
MIVDQTRSALCRIWGSCHEFKSRRPDHFTAAASSKAAATKTRNEAIHRSATTKDARRGIAGPTPSTREVAPLREATSCSLRTSSRPLRPPVERVEGVVVSEGAIPKGARVEPASHCSRRVTGGRPLLL